MEIDVDRDITRHPDGTLEVFLLPQRSADVEGEEQVASETVSLRPGEGGYTDALAAWDLQQDPDRAPAVSTASGREQAGKLVHEALDPAVSIPEAIESVSEPQAAAEALRHVLVGGAPSVADFAKEVAEAHDDEEPAPTHQVTKTIGNVLADLEE